MASDAERRIDPRWGLGVAGAIALVHALILFTRGHPYDIDRLTYWIPASETFRAAWAAGDWPIWAPAFWAGFPLHGEGQAGFFSPLKLVHLFTSDPVTALDAEHLLVLPLAAIGGALAARLLGSTAPGAAACGVVWALGGSMLAWQASPGMVATHALLPLAVALGLRQRWFPLALTLGVTVLAGHPYGYALTFVAAGVAWLVGDDERLAPGPRIGWGLAAVGLALAIGAVTWLPTTDLVLRSDRWTGSGPARANPIHLGDLRHWVVPWIDRRVRYSTEGGVLTYVGLPALALAIAGGALLIRERAGRVVVGLGAGVLVIALAASAGEGLDLPLLRLLRGPSKLLFLVFAALALCVARGVDRLRELHPAAAWIAVVVIAVDVGSYGQRHIDPVPRDALRAPPAVARLLPPGARLRVVNVESPWAREFPAGAAERAAFLDGALPLDANVGALYGFTHLAGYSPLLPPRGLAFARSYAAHLLRRGSVTHLVTEPGRALSPPFERVAASPRWTVFRVPDTRPRAFVSAAAIPAADARAAFRLVPRAGDGRVVVEGGGALPRGAPGVRAAEVLRWSPTRIELAVDLSESAVVGVADAYDPGWTAEIDGRPAEVRPVDGAFKGVVAPAGTQRVTFTYSPGAFRLGLGVTGWSVFGLLLFAFAGAWLRRS